MRATREDPSRRLRHFLLAIVVFGLVGTAAELLLLEHYEDSAQLAPLFFIALALVAIIGHLLTGGEGSLLLLRAIMAFLVLTGAFGVVLHYRTSMADQLETNPTHSGWALFSEVMGTTSPPPLAPGVVAQLGLLGLLYTYRHPARRRRSFEDDIPNDDEITSRGT